MPGTPLVEPSNRRRTLDAENMNQAAYVLDEIRRGAVLNAIQQVCAYRAWILLAAHVRTNHVHVVVEADPLPEKVMNDFKTYASRGLNKMKIDLPDRKRWSRHGSTRYLWNPLQIAAAMHYVTAEQGEPMSVYERFED